MATMKTVTSTNILRPTATPTFTTTYTSPYYLNCSLTGTVPTTLTYTHSTYLSVEVNLPMAHGSCARAFLCDKPQIKDDIIGIGVIVAFFITAWAAFIFLIIAYWTGLLPQHLLRPIDRKMFKANSRWCHSEWKETLDHVTLLFSDQQLLTGIGILLAGYYEVFARDLDIVHWHIVTYLAWMSSTVHLITLSLLKDRLHEQRTLRDLRLAGMLILLALLIPALAPSVSLFFVSTPTMLPRASEHYSYYAHGGAAVPTRCFYGFGYGDYWHPYEDFRYRRAYYEGSGYSLDSYIALPAILSYTTLICSYIWKFTQLFDQSLSWYRRTVRYMPEAKLELTARHNLTKHRKPTPRDLCMYFVIKVTYLTFCVVADVLDSFATTNLVLFFTLIWGTLQVILPRTWLIQETKNAETLSFGQILPLLLLLQPVVAVVAHFAAKERTPSNRHSSAVYETLLPYRIPAYATLADALRHGPLLTANEKSLGHYDPIKEHLRSSRSYHGLLWTLLMGFFGLGAVFVIFGLIVRLDDIFATYIIGFTIACWSGWLILWMVILLPFSTKLR